MRTKTIEMISDAVRKRYGKMVSVSNIVEFLFENQIATWVGFRNYYLRKRFEEEKIKKPGVPADSIYIDLSIEVDTSKETVRYVVGNGCDSTVA